MNETNNITMTEIFALADRFKELREERDNLKEQLAAANKALDEAEAHLTDVMAAAECGSFTRSGKQFIMTTTTRWSADKEHKDELYAVLRKNGYDQLFTVNHQTLGSFVRELIEETTADNAGSPCGSDPHIPEWLDGLVKSYDDIGITIKKSNK